MRKIRQFVILALALTALAGCSMTNNIRGSGVAVERSFNQSDFTAVSTSGSSHLTIQKGETFSVQITADENVTDYLDVYVSADTLHIGLKQGYYYENIILEAQITMPELKELHVEDASQADVSGFSLSGTTDITVLDNSVVTMNYEKMGDINATVDVSSELSIETRSISGDLDFRSEGSSYIAFNAGSGSGDVDLVSTGSSYIDMKDYLAEDVNVEIADSSNVWVRMSGDVSGTVIESSVLRYRGLPGDLEIEFASSASSF